MNQHKILLGAVLVLACLSGSLGANKLCELLAYKACLNETAVGDIPENKEALDSQCKLLLKMEECINNDLKTCNLKDEKLGYRDSDWLEMRQVGLSVRLPVCKLDPETYLNFLSVLPCYKKAFKPASTICRESTDKSISALQKRIHRLLVNENETFSFVYDNCLKALLTRNCVVEIQNKQCGPVSGKVTFLMTKKLEDWDQLCPLDIRIDIIELLDDLSSLTGKEISVKEYIMTDTLS